MAEYIERHALRLQFQHEHITNSVVKDHKTARAWEGALMLLEDAPAADVVEVRHGEWVDKGRYFPYCSECGTWTDWSNGTAEFNYCPNCGAKMDGKGDKQ